MGKLLNLVRDTLRIMRDDARRLADMRNSEDIWDFWMEEDDSEQA
jgi:hypothetical protein